MSLYMAQGNTSTSSSTCISAQLVTDENLSNCDATAHLTLLPRAMRLETTDKAI